MICLRSKSLIPLLITSLLFQAPARTQNPLLEKAYKKAHEAWLAKDYPKGIAWLKPLRSQLHERQGAEDLLGALHYSLGWKEYRARRPRQAKREFEQAANLKPREKNVWYSLGLACGALGEKRNAEKNFRRTLTIDPAHFDALLSLASLAYEAEQYPKARGYLERAGKIHPRDPTLLLLREKTSQDQVLIREFRGLTSTHFKLRFGGGIPKSDRATHKILTYLERCHRDLVKILGSAPEHRIQVVLYSKREFSALHGVTDWMGAFYDGKVRIPYQSWHKRREKVQELIRHELTHAFLSEILPGASSWLQEGVAQWYQGRRSRESGRLFQKSAPRSARDLRSPFARVQDPELAARLYLQSLILIEDLLDRKGIEALRQLLSTTAKGSAKYAIREDKALEALLGSNLETWIRKLAKKRSWARPAR